MTKYIIATIVTLVIVFVVISNNTKTAMDKCQVKHSYETCFNAINR